jgi:hypothetical protein
VSVTPAGAEEEVKAMSIEHLSTRVNGESSGSLEDYRRELEQEVLRLRQHVVHVMNRLAGQVLDQIQTTRGLADATESLLIEIKGSGAADHPQGGVEARLRWLSSKIEEAMRELPEPLWERYTQSCKELARTMR